MGAPKGNKNNPYLNLTENQKRVMAIYNRAMDHRKKSNYEPYIEQFDTKWIGKGYLPNYKHYVRLAIGDLPMDNQTFELCITIANFGYEDAKEKFKVDLYFTQALLYGAAIYGKHNNFRVILSSQYGKSFVTGLIAVRLAERGDPVNVIANSTSLTTTIMNSAMACLQKADESIRKKLNTNGLDKIEKGEVSVSKDILAFRGGGSIRSASVGGSRKDALDNNNAMGKDGHQFQDESALIEDAAYAETGRSQFGVSKDGNKYIKYEISNPHRLGHFSRDMMEEDLLETDFLVWGDIGITIEEGRIKWKEKEFMKTTFFNDKVKVITYLLCRFENIEEGAFFGRKLIIDDTDIDFETSKFFMGIDPSEEGDDMFNMNILELRKNGTMRCIISEDLKPKGDWNDEVTPDAILDKILYNIYAYKVKGVAVDGAYAQYIAANLAKRQYVNGFKLFKCSYQKGTTEIKKINKITSALEGDRFRDEIYLDLKFFLDEGRMYATTETAGKLQPQLNSIGHHETTSNGKIKIESKTKVRQRIGRSPDDLDGLMLAVHACHCYRLNEIAGGEYFGII